MEWKDINLKQFYEIQNILSVEDDYTYFNIIDLLFGVDSANMPINEFITNYNGILEFLNKPIPTIDNLPTTMTINGKEYQTSIDLTSVKTSQFIDYNNYSKEQEPKVEKLLSVFFIPTNHNYNDGYCLSDVWNDLLTLDMVTINSYAFFFKKLYILFLEISLTCLTLKTQKSKLTKNQKQLIINQINSLSLESYLT